MRFDKKTEEGDIAKLLGQKIVTNFGVGRSMMMMMMVVAILAAYYTMLGLACFAVRVVISFMTTVISFMTTVLKSWYYLHVSI
jgi:hypothetical protein